MEFKIKSNFYISTLSKEEKQSLLYKTVYLTRDQIYSIINNPRFNARNKAVLFMAFEGLDGREHSEIRHLKKVNLEEGNSIAVPGERSRIINVPQKLIDILNDANDLTGMDRNIKNYKAKTDKSYFRDNGCIIKNSQKSRSPVSKQVINNIISDMLNESGFPVGNPVEYIIKSGQLDYFKRTRSELGIEEIQEINIDVFEKLCYRYGMNKNSCHSLKTFMLNNDDGRFYYNNPEQTDIIYSIFESIAINFTVKKSNSTSEDEDDYQDNLDDEEKESPDWLNICGKLGVIGEIVADHILQSKFEYVKDTTKIYRLGYDFKVYDRSQKSSLL